MNKIAPTRFVAWKESQLRMTKTLRCPERGLVFFNRNFQDKHPKLKQ
jgi:hypothetical protein